MTDAPKQEIIDQHIGWLKLYLAEMRPENWRDMRDYAERQVERLQRDICR